VLESCTKFLEGTLKLKVNRKKSTTGSPTKLKFLGFRIQETKNGIGIQVHEKPIQRLKEKLRAITSRKRSGTIGQILQEVSRALNGWVNYYGIANMKSELQHICSWLRRRIRQLIWKRWKKGSTRFENLKRLGVPAYQAWQWANTRKGYWKIANSAILKTTLTNQYLEKLGFPDVVKRFEVLHATH
jgi:hypothetical protein